MPAMVTHELSLWRNLKNVFLSHLWQRQPAPFRRARTYIRISKTLDFFINDHHNDEDDDFHLQFHIKRYGIFALAHFLVAFRLCLAAIESCSTIACPRARLWCLWIRLVCVCVFVCRFFDGLAGRHLCHTWWFAARPRHSLRTFSSLQSCRFPLGNLLQICAHWTLHSLFCFILLESSRFGPLHNLFAHSRCAIESGCMHRTLHVVTSSCGVCIAESWLLGSWYATPIKMQTARICVLSAMPSTQRDGECKGEANAHIHIYTNCLSAEMVFFFLQSFLCFMNFHFLLHRSWSCWDLRSLRLAARYFKSEWISEWNRNQGPMGLPVTFPLFRQTSVRLIICHCSIHNTNNK